MCCVEQVGSSSAYLETLSQVRQVAENAAATGADSPNDERQQASFNICNAESERGAVQASWTHVML